MNALLRQYLLARLWRETSRPLPELERLTDEALTVLAATSPGLAEGLDTWRENVSWLAALESEVEKKEEPVKAADIPGFDRPVDRALKLRRLVKNGEFES